MRSELQMSVRFGTRSPRELERQISVQGKGGCHIEWEETFYSNFSLKNVVKISIFIICYEGDTQKKGRRK